ncbi:MAG: M50 family metallopeptidase [Candidatus Riflebacteria bacterium]|nr:M50 family metallopeptidase [Candidatus Riflebacteria bacterium]
MSENITGISISTQRMIFAILLFIASAILWESWIVYPIKILTVFLHELSHGIAALATNGSIDHIEISSNEGGVCFTRGGNRFLILSAGYLGSLIWGAGLLLAAARTRLDREIVAALGGLLVLVTLGLVRSFFGFAFGIGAGLVLIFFSRQFGEAACDVLLRWIGLTSSLYVILDIKSDLIDRSVPDSDAYKIAEMLHLPSMLVGGVWLVIALFISWKALSAALPGSEEGEDTPRLPRGQDPFA